MKISNNISETYINELSQTKVNILFSEQSISGYPDFNIDTSRVEIYKRPEEEGFRFVPFSIEINNRFKQDPDNIFAWNSEYMEYINNITKDVLSEIDANINLRTGKWDILDYLSVLRRRLNEIRESYYQDMTDGGQTFGRKHICKSRSKIVSNKNLFLNFPGTGDWVGYVLAQYWIMQMDSIDKILGYIKQREEVIEKTDDYVREVFELSDYYRSLKWEASDTDLLELITALIESGSLQNSTKSLTRKEAIDFFSGIFNLEIKDAESKLSRATERKKDISPFLTRLKENFEKYAQKKEERIENIRK